MINKLVTDLIDNTKAGLEQLKPAAIDDVRAQTAPVAVLSADVFEQHTELKQFLKKNLYRHDKVREMTDKAREMVAVLFDRYMSDTKTMRPEFANLAADAADETG